MKRNGFKFLTTDYLYWYTAMKNARIFTVPSNISPQIADLLNHLRDSGTGRSKLDMLLSIAQRVKNGLEFLTVARDVLQPVTWNKIDAYLAALKAAEVPVPELPPVAMDEEDTALLNESSITPPQNSDEPEVKNTNEIEDSPARTFSAQEAIHAIKHGQFNKTQLEAIVVMETRTSVIEAAQKKLDTLE